MKGADDMIGLVLGAVLGSGLYGAEKSMQIDSRTRKRYAKAFAMEQEAHRLVEAKKQAADNAMKKLSNRQRSILITSMQNFVAVYSKNRIKYLPVIRRTFLNMPAIQRSLR